MSKEYIAVKLLEIYRRNCSSTYTINDLFNDYNEILDRLTIKLNININNELITSDDILKG